MMDRASAERFAREWAASWHSKDLDTLLTHYSPDIVFRSPRIAVVLGRPQAYVSGLIELRYYWRKALEAVQDVRFEIIGVGVGSDALTIVYRNQRNDHVAETLVFGVDGKIVEGIVSYFQSPEA